MNLNAKHKNSTKCSKQIIFHNPPTHLYSNWQIDYVINGWTLMQVEFENTILNLVKAG